MGEHLPCKQGVMGSNPIISTIFQDRGVASGLKNSVADGLEKPYNSNLFELRVQNPVIFTKAIWREDRRETSQRSGLNKKEPERNRSVAQVARAHA